MGLKINTMSVLKKELRHLSVDRMHYLGIKAKVLTDDIDNEFLKEKFTMFEVFYTISLALLSLLERYGNKSLDYFTEIFNEMCLINQHKEN